MPVIREGGEYTGSLKKIKTGEVRKDEKPKAEEKPKAVHGDDRG